MNILETRVRNYIRNKMVNRQLEDVFKIIQEEYSSVYHEDNIYDRKEFLHELVEKTLPE
jgi:hypothetical protein